MKFAELRRASSDNGGRPCLYVPVSTTIPYRMNTGQTHLSRSASVKGRRRVAARRATSSLAPFANDGSVYVSFGADDDDIERRC